MKCFFIAFFTLSSLFLSTSIYGVKFVNNQYVPADYIVMADQITEVVKDKLIKRYNMRVIGVAGGMADCVNLVGLSFQIRRPLSKERLREIIVDSVEEFLTSINKNERLRPFLKNYPFTAKEIEIEIFIVDNTGREVYDPEIMLAAAYRGTVKYRTEDKDNKFGYKSTTEESYETALKIVKESLKK